MENQKKISYTKETLEYLILKCQDSSLIANSKYLESIQKGKITPVQRETLMNWVIELSESQHLASKTVQLAIYFIDSFLSQKPISNFSLLELVGLICISIALKYEEGREMPPCAICALCDQRFSQEAIITTELYILSVLNWKIDLPTPNELLNYLFAFTCEDFDSNKINKCAEAFISVALTDYEISRNSPIIIAVSSALCVLQKAKFEDFCKDWLDVLEKEVLLNSNECCQVAQMISDKVKCLSLSA